MGRYKYLLKNVGLLTLSNFATKLLSFFLVPLYTNILLAEEYGIYDLFNTTIGVLLPILTLNIQEAVLRFALDNNLSKKSIVSIGSRYFIISNIIIISGLVLNCVLDISVIVKEYTLFFFLMYFVQSLSGIVMAYSRGIDRIADLSVSSVICSAIIILCNVLFLVYFEWGIVGYFLANIVGPLIQCIYLLLRAQVFRDVRLTRKYDAETKEMLNYSRPMIANSIAWWVNNAADKYIITWILGLAENGIYSVAAKIPSILNVFATIFSQAWTLSAVKDFDSKDKNGFFANTYSAYNCLLTLVCSAIIVGDKILAYLLYAKDFYVAWKYVPWLTIAIVFSSLSGYIGGFFTAVKNSKIFAQSSALSAGINIVLNLIFTPFIGAMGAAIATAICYFVMWFVRYFHSKRIIELKIRLKRDAFSYILLVIQAVLLLCIENELIMYCCEATLFVIIVILYVPELKLISKSLGMVHSKCEK